VSKAQTPRSVVVTGPEEVRVVLELGECARVESGGAFGRDGIGWLTSRGRSGVAVWTDGRCEVFGGCRG
jgi:hypothetical protein